MVQYYKTKSTRYVGKINQVRRRSIRNVFFLQFTACEQTQLCKRKL